MSTFFNPAGPWFKGNLHTHTTRSDGKLTPEEVVQVYQKAGYDFLALTDHWVQSENKRQDGMLLLAGCEWDTGNGKNPVFHLIGVGMEQKLTLERTESLRPQQVIDAINNSGGLAILAHPAWSITNPADMMALKGLAGIEIYNSASELPWNGRRADAGLYADICATNGVLFPCVASDDSHFYGGEQTHSYIMVNAPELSAGAVKKAVREGRFYASQGPRFVSVEIQKESIEVRCSKVESVVFYSNTVWCRDRVTTGGVDSAVYMIKPTDRYVRIELIDSKGNMAWTSPFRVND